MYCRKCSNSIPNSSLNCPICGTKVSASNSFAENSLSKGASNSSDTKLSKIVAILFAVISSLTMLLFILLPQGAIKKIENQQPYDMFNLFKSTTMNYNFYKISGDYDDLVNAIKDGTLSENTVSTDENFDFYKNYDFHQKIISYTTAKSPAYFEKYIAASVIALLIVGLYTMYKVLKTFEKSFVAQNVSAYTNIIVAILLLLVSYVIKWDYYLAKDTLISANYITFSPILIFYLILGIVQKIIITLQMHKFGIVLSSHIGELTTE